MLRYGRYHYFDPKLILGEAAALMALTIAIAATIIVRITPTSQSVNFGGDSDHNKSWSY